MTKVSPELLGIEVDTDDPGESAQNLGLRVIDVTPMMAVVGAGAYLYNTARQKANVIDDDVNIPGVQPMPGTLSYNEDLAELDGDVRPIRGSDFDQDMIRAGAEVTVYREKIPQDRDLWFGAGGKDRESADSSSMHADIVVMGSGSDTEGDTISDMLYAAITDSDGCAIFTRKLGDLELLAEYASESPTECPLMYSLAPYVTAGRHAEFRIGAGSSSDGKGIDPANGDVMLYRSSL